ncbi:MAG TPA: hypothetical protein VEQ11_08190 [Chloroflexota bacterium]|nr:hypothetical protein [Chloroflexota bacterium]
MAATNVHKHVPDVHYDEEGLLGTRAAAAYNDAEQAYSSLLYSRVEQLLSGERNALLFLRKYPREPHRLGAMPTPEGVDRTKLRIDIVERMATDALVYLSEHSAGGPVAQATDGDGRLIETRKFPTRYPHIIIERTDVYRKGARRAEHIEWTARRVQNQRFANMINRSLEIAGLGMEVFKLFVP